MRETVGSIVSATERLSMLKPRPLKSPATRARTPNSFSTRTEMVWRIRSVWSVAAEDLHDLVLAHELGLRWTNVDGLDLARVRRCTREETLPSEPCHDPAARVVGREGTDRGPGAEHVAVHGAGVADQHAGPLEARGEVDGSQCQ